jgi:hypothetical protein
MNKVYYRQQRLQVVSKEMKIGAHLVYCMLAPDELLNISTVENTE